MRVRVGVITGAQGVKGVVRVKSLTANPSDLLAYGEVSDARGHPLAMAPVGVPKGAMLNLRIAGIASREAAEALKGTELFIERNSLPTTAAEEFYACDLIGLAVRDETGAPLGTVRDVADYGAGDVLILAIGERVIDLPFAKAFFPEVDCRAGYVTVRLPTEIEADHG
ncbi:MAG TPA: ribosome maturation factor RimM [Dongiaceae bacterium]|jgi:16S rRNA processing protein RimM|nr:ribosome maturation factor RimM [Dongiaceae bacterium]